jgi:four helix bundle protein
VSDSKPNVMKDFKKLVVWQKAHELVLLVYRLTKKFPKEERFNLIDQMRRAATSIATNIAEGCGKYSQKDFVAYLQVSQGSSQEIEYLTILSKDLEYIATEEYNDLNDRVNEVKAMLIGLIQKVRRDNNLT